jgi:hypothetical protein
MTNPFASSGSGPTVPATPQTPSAPEKTRAIRACHAPAFNTRESYAGRGDGERPLGNRFRISCLTFIIVGGSMAAEDISGVDVAIAGVDIVDWNEIRRGGP